MTRELSLTELVTLLGTMPLEVEHANHRALEKIAGMVEQEAKRVIGTYEYGWPPLAESTLAKKAADTPLLETGQMRDSIEHMSNAHEARVGSNDDKAVWQELGTNRIPPRPFLQGAVQHKMPEALQIVGRHAVAALSGTKV